MVSKLNLFLIMSTLAIAANAMTLGDLLRAFTNVETTCIELQTKEIFFTGKCTLKQSDIQNNLDKLKTYVVTQPNTMTIEQLLSNGFANSADYYLQTNTNYINEYKDFEKKIIAIMNKIKTTTKDAVISEFKDAITDSKMDIAYPNITRNFTRYCPRDSNTCPRIASMLNLNETTIAELTVDEFLDETFKNVFVYLSSPQQAELDYTDDETSVGKLLSELREKGTTGTTVQYLKPLFNGIFYNQIRYQFSTDFTTRSTKKIRTTTTKKPTKTPAEKVTKTTTLPYVSQAVYISIPLTFLCIGILLAVAIVVFYYNLQPNVGGKKPNAVPIFTGTYQQKAEKF